MLGLTLGLLVAFAAAAQQGTSTLNQKIAPLLHPSDITQLEWSFLRARLSQVEEREHILTDTGSGSCCAAYWYDPAKNKIMVRFRYAPDTLDHLTMQNAKERLRAAAVDAIGGVKYELEQKPGVRLELNDFEVEFITWDEHAQFKTFAIYRNDHVEFVDHPLK